MTAELSRIFISIAIMLAFGFLLQRLGLLSERFQRELAEFMMLAVMPLSILSSSNSEFHAELLQQLGIAALLVALYYSFALLIFSHLGRRLCQKNEERSGIFTTCVVFANTAFIGFPLIHALFGKEGMLYAIVYNMLYQLFFFGFGVGLIRRQKHFDWRAVMRDPGMLASVWTILLYLSPWRLPEAVYYGFDLIGNMMVPLSMLLIGCALAKLKWLDIFTDGQVWLISLFRLLLLPAVVWGLLRALGAAPVMTAVLTLLTALPVGSFNLVVAEQAAADAPFASRAIVQSMLLMLLTLPLILLFL